MDSVIFLASLVVKKSIVCLTFLQKRTSEAAWVVAFFNPCGLLAGVGIFYPSLPKISSVVNKYTTLLQATANCKKAFPNPPVIAYRRNASLRDLLVHSTLSH